MKIQQKLRNKQQHDIVNVFIEWPLSNCRASRLSDRAAHLTVPLKNNKGR
jgi:hypothetical protein